MDCTQLDQYLDAMIDGTLDADDLRAVEAHCQGCVECSEKLRVNRQMMRMFDDMAPEIDVPLTAQAAWRSAVKREAARGRQGKRVRIAGGIAAVVAVAVIATFALHPPSGNTATLRAEDTAGVMEAAEEYALSDDALIETDGAMEEFEAFSEAAPVPFAANTLDKAVPATAMHEIDMVVEDVDRVCDYARDLAQEYAGEIDIQRFDEDGVSCANLYIDLPQANAGEFFEAIRHFDQTDSGLEEIEVTGETSMLLVLRSE